MDNQWLVKTRGIYLRINEKHIKRIEEARRDRQTKLDSSQSGL